MSKDKRNHRWSRLYVPVAIVFWIALWQLVAVLTDSKLLFASPVDTLLALRRLLFTERFLLSVCNSFLRIAGGFCLAVVCGVVLALLASVFRPIRILLNPLLRLMKAVPVASFIIIALLWISSKQLSILISFLMVLPVIYTNVLQGLQSTGSELLEMADVFRLRFFIRLRYIYLPAVLPYFVSACSVGLGFCFKSGIAAEVIGLPSNSIGENLYQAKLYLLTDELFAWTAVIVLVSVVFEKAVMWLVRLLMKRCVGGKYRVRSRAQVEKAPVAENTEQYGLFSVDKAFDGKQVLSDCTVLVGAGEAVALMGPSGVGKSTAMKLLLGVYEPDAGEVRRPAKLGVVFQEDRLCPQFDAVTNIALVTGRPEEAREALVALSLTDTEGKPVSELSGGMKRRVAILRALLSDCSLLVFDEPFTGLDDDSRRAVASFMRERLLSRAMVMVTHHEEEAAALTTRTIYMKEGMR